MLLHGVPSGSDADLDTNPGARSDVTQHGDGLHPSLPSSKHLVLNDIPCVATNEIWNLWDKLLGWRRAVGCKIEHLSLNMCFVQPDTTERFTQIAGMHEMELAEKDCCLDP